MPELPEVETVVRQLRRRITGQHIGRVRLLDQKLQVDRPGRLRGCRVRDVERFGKLVVLVLAPSGARARDLWLAVHLRMTGRLVLSDGPRQPDLRHLRATIALDQDDLLFYDPRRFGWITLTDSPDPIAPRGLDPLTRSFTPAALAALAAGSRQALKPWLLRQDRLAGLGNIYASEIPFQAGLHPARVMGSLSPAELGRLYQAIRAILDQAIRYGGTTFSDFRDTSGGRGGYAPYLQVYGREDAPCLSCGTPIARTVQQQRSTFFCPRCQSND